jgi:hypothetical protein
MNNRQLILGAAFVNVSSMQRREPIRPLPIRMAKRMTAQPHITVIIPTRERADVLEKSLKTCTAQDYDNLTILISDNLSQDRTKEIVLATNDPRVRYVNTGKRLSMSQNYEFAMSHVDDGWVSIIGDDDGLLPRAIEKIADIIADTSVQAVRSDVCIYRWPGVMGNRFGSLTVPLNRGFEVRQSSQWLSRVMSGISLYPNLPMLYSGGFVTAEILRQVKAHTGKFYHSCIPDVFSAFAIASVVENYVWSFEPVAIDGVSKHSIGTSFINRAHDKSAALTFLAENDIPLHSDIPPGPDGHVPRVHQAWIYESYLQSRFLRDGPDDCTHAQQLRIALGSITASATEREWGRAFANQHGLDFGRIDEEAQKGKERRKLSRAWRRARSALDTYYVADDRTMPIGDVYQASVSAGKILDASPGRVELLRNLAGKALSKVAVK